MKNLVLIGFMGSGKSTIGRLVASELKMQFVDMDKWIEEQEGMSITDIFHQKGEPMFRDLEEQAVKKLAMQQGFVIATGGGVVLRKSNLEALGQAGVLIYLHIDAKTAFTRTREHVHRPLLKTENTLEHIEKLLKERQGFYNSIPHCVQSVGRSSQEIAASVIRIYRASSK